MSSTSQVSLQEQALMADAASLANTLGPMALPIFFILWPIIISVVTGIFLNWWYALNPPLIYGFSPGWLNLPVWGFIEIYYTIRHWKRATKASWVTKRYWIGKRYFDNDFKLDHWEFVGRAVKKIVMTETGEGTQPVTVEGIETAKYGFINKPHLYHKKPSGEIVDLAGDLIYEFHYRSKRFPLALVALPDVPERLLSFEGNLGIIIDGGLMFETEHIAAVSYVRCDFTKTETVPFVPIGVFTDYAQLAQDVAEERAIVYAGPEAVQVAAKARDTFYASDYLRKWKDEEVLRTKVEDQEKNIDKIIDRRVGAMSKADDKVLEGIIPSGSSSGVDRARSLLPWIVFGAIIMTIIIVLRYA